MKGTLPVERPESSLTPAKRSSDGADRHRLRELLKQHFGYSDFRGLQLEAIEAVLSGKDCFCLMPTGGGKSICYELPALAKTGVVIVVSPLIALMENQVAALKKQQISAEFLSSTRSAAQKAKIYEDLESGRPSLKLLYVTPELITTGVFMQKLKKLHGRGLLSLVAVDEAHCISSWGHDFRPSYKKLSSIRSNLPGTPILALTATAARKVQQDVVESLCLHKPQILLTSFNRPNIFYEVRYKDLLGSAYEDLRGTLLKNPKECGIIYCHTRQTCDEIGGQLRNDGICCRVYHAGVNAQDRTRALEDWTSGKVAIVVATVAFGMGIDRKDVRIVCHFNVPKSLEGFYQESGRAGRDQMPARSILYYGIDDRKTMEYLIKQKAQKELKDAGREHLKDSMKSFQQMVAYCEEAGCRRKRVLEHFGEQVSLTLCGKTCDACKWPQRLSENLEALACVSTSAWPSVTVQSAQPVEKSEFWNYEEEEDKSEEEVSESDEDEETGIARAVANKAGTVAERRMEALLRAEQQFLVASQQEKCRTLVLKRSVDQELRSSATTRILSMVNEAMRRHGSQAADMGDSYASALEAECFNKFGKSGRTFYNSQVASIVRWLSSCSAEELRARAGT